MQCKKLGGWKVCVKVELCIISVAMLTESMKSDYMTLRKQADDEK